ncbi:MAG: MBL fold metallo-hydrolase [Phaeodactylibacter sp.]|nr:MBL fold metallo-hydrolase [Phaeodactylibacter sp.]MCB9303535.1 MBL fold metallo-hydrolase [Lewinellaceae bacterium]
MIQYKTPQICIFESALYRTTCTLVQTPEMLLLVDPNWLPREVYRIRQFVQETRQGRPLYLLFTHSDYDHILGWKAFPDATVIASRAFVRQPQKEKILEQIHKFDEEYYLDRDYDIEYPKVDIEISEDGQVLELEGVRLRFWRSPGHTADGLFTLVENTATWIAGDYLSNMEFPFISYSSSAYEKTLEKARYIIDEYQSALLIPGHGDATGDRIEMLRRWQESLEYIDKLKTAVETGKPFPEDLLWQRYPHRRGLEGPHRENMEFLRKEQGKERL